MINIVADHPDYVKYRRQWTEKDLEWLKQNYHKYTDKVLSKKFNRTELAVRVKRYELGLIKGHPRCFTPEEVEFIRNNYLQKTDKEIGAILNRTGEAIERYRRKHGWKKTLQ